VESITAEEAAGHFGWIGRFFGMGLSFSSTITQEQFGWTPTGPTLLEDIADGAYFSV
ncbi:MAG: hypothetical protein QOJ72_184, partial [Nocardioidaceae bacterium]|nr:hypothetical protein [Nocardioidaceae bacterium]